MKEKEMQRMQIGEQIYIKNWSPERLEKVNQMYELILNSYLTKEKWFWLKWLNSVALLLLILLTGNELWKFIIPRCIFSTWNWLCKAIVKILIGWCGLEDVLLLNASKLVWIVLILRCQFFSEFWCLLLGHELLRLSFKLIGRNLSFFVGILLLMSSCLILLYKLL